MNIDLQELVILLLFIAPGFLYSRAYLAARPRYQRAPDLFQQTVLAVVGSTFVHAVLLSVLAFVTFLGALVYTLWTGRVAIVREIVYIPATVAEAPVWVIAAYILIATLYITASLILARRAGAWLGHLLPERVSRWHRWYRFLTGGEPPEQVLLWYKTLYEEPLRLGISTPRVVAWLRSGERFEGNLAELRVCADEANVIELALVDATFQASETTRPKPAAGRTLQPTPLPRHRVLLRSSDILWLSRLEPSEEARPI